MNKKFALFSFGYLVYLVLDAHARISELEKNTEALLDVGETQQDTIEIIQDTLDQMTQDVQFSPNVSRKLRRLKK